MQCMLLRFNIFLKTPEAYQGRILAKKMLNWCKVFCEENGLESVAHSPYPTNLTPKGEQEKQRVIDSLVCDLLIADACGSIGIVVRFGKKISHNGPLISYQVMIDMLDEVLSNWEGNDEILLENNAGKPGTIGTTLEELVQVRNLCEQADKIGFCLDTCHAFASGLWNGKNWADVREKGLALGYFDHLKVIHFNNSKYETGLGKDRHANIFDHGYITVAAFDELFDTPELAA